MKKGIESGMRNHPNQRILVMNGDTSLSAHRNGEWEDLGEYEQLREENQQLKFKNNEIQGQVKVWQEIYQGQIKREIEELKKLNKELREENERLKKELEQKNQRVLIRQFALNVEFECKLSIANLLSQEVLEELGVNVEYQTDYFEDIKRIQVRKLWSKLEAEERKDLWEQWFPNISLDFDSMVDALVSLKNVFNAEAHPTAYEGVAVTPSSIKEFISLHQEFIMVDNSDFKTKRKTLRKPTKDALGKWNEHLIELLSGMRTQNEPFLKKV